MLTPSWIWFSILLLIFLRCWTYEAPATWSSCHGWSFLTLCRTTVVFIATVSCKSKLSYLIGDSMQFFEHPQVFRHLYGRSSRQSPDSSVYLEIPNNTDFTVGSSKVSYQGVNYHLLWRIRILHQLWWLILCANLEGFFFSFFLFFFWWD